MLLNAQLLYSKKHIHEVQKRFLGLLGWWTTYAKRFLPLKSLKNLHTSLVDPHFRYCCAVWGVCGITEIQQLQKLQNRAARLITGSNYDTPSRPLINYLSWKTIEDLIQHESQIMVFKSWNGLVPQYLFDLFAANSSDSSYSLRNTANDLKLNTANDHKL